MSNINAFEDALKTLHKLAEESNINKEVLSILSQPEQTMIASIPVKMDSGAIKVFKGYRSRYSTVLGPAKGGIRFHPLVNEGEVNRLALWMAIKTSLVGLPYGGAKGGVIVDANKLSKQELERLSRGYMSAMSGVLGPYIDIAAPDIATNPTIMGWMVDEYEKINKIKCPALLTGKPVELGGMEFRIESTGYGVFVTTQLLMQKLGEITSNISVAIQGFGNVGSYLAKYMFDAGYKVVAISDMQGGIYCENGIDINQIIHNLSINKKANIYISDSSISGFIDKLKIISNEELLELDVKLLIPAAIDDVITTNNAKLIKAKYIVEAANAPITADADSILEKNNVIILPDVLANSGGVIGSYFEWVQNLQFVTWSNDEVKQKLTKILDNSFTKVWNIKESSNKSLRSASYFIALNRLQDTILAKINR